MSKKSVTPKKGASAPSKVDNPYSQSASTKKPFGNFKFSPSKKPGETAAERSNQSEKTFLKVSLIGKRAKGSKQGVIFWLVREDGVLLSCWADKVTADMVYQSNRVLVEECGVQAKVFKLHNADGVPLKGYKGFDRRCYVIVAEELPDEDEIRALMNYIADEINKFPTLKESQKVFVPEDFIVEDEVPFVAKLGNEQTVALCESVMVPLAELQSYYCQNTQEFANFWAKGTMTAKIAAFFGVGSEWILPSEKA